MPICWLHQHQNRNVIERRIVACVSSSAQVYKCSANCSVMTVNEYS